MTVFRLAAEKFKDDLSGKGEEIYGGRWNPVGYALLYTSQSRALANLEIMVTIVPGVMPIGYYILEIEIPDTAPIYFKVPSACIMHEYNYLINPAHPSIKEIKLLRSEPFEFDERLFNS